MAVPDPRELHLPRNYRYPCCASAWDMVSKENKIYGRGWRGYHWNGKIIEPADVARAALYLVFDDSAGITGITRD